MVATDSDGDSCDGSEGEQEKAAHEKAAQKKRSRRKKLQEKLTRAAKEDPTVHDGKRLCLVANCGSK